MANSAHNTNVIPLPTAAKRHVVNPLGLAYLDASANLPKHPAEWDDHGGGKNWDQATFRRSPEMLVITAIMKVLSPEQKDRIRGYVATMADMNMCHHAPAALHIVEACC